MPVPRQRRSSGSYDFYFSSTRPFQRQVHSRPSSENVIYLALILAVVIFVSTVFTIAGDRFHPGYGGYLLDSRVASVVTLPGDESADFSLDEMEPPPPAVLVQTRSLASSSSNNRVDAELNEEEDLLLSDDEEVSVDGSGRDELPSQKGNSEDDDDENNRGDRETTADDEVDISKLTRTEQYAMFSAEIGILSDTPFENYLEKHKEIDNFDNTKRCRRYGYSYSKTQERNRRIFYGAVMQDEPWELFEILAAESYGLLEAMVFVELDRDYYGEHRTPLRLEAAQVLKSMFGIENVRVIKYSNDDPNIKGELLHDMARNEIVKVWKELGMTVDDVGYLSNIDDIFARDYIKAIHHCELPEMKYDLHHCLYNRVKVFGNNQVYETSPECVSRTKRYEHPDMMIGACIEGIGDETAHILAPRDETGIYRQKGWNCEDRETEKDIKDEKYPLWSAADIRGLCGGRQANLRAAKHQQYTAFHFRNFYNTARDMRLKVTTEAELYDKSMDDLGEDPMRVTYRCIKDIPDEQNAVWKREPGGYSVLKPMTPLYFGNDAYRAAAHERATKKILDDEKMVKPSAKKGNAETGKKKEEQPAEKKKTKKKKNPKKDLKKQTGEKTTKK